MSITHFGLFAKPPTDMLRLRSCGSRLSLWNAQHFGRYSDRDLNIARRTMRNIPRLASRTWKTTSSSWVRLSGMFAKRTSSSMTKPDRALSSDLSFPWFFKVRKEFKVTLIIFIFCIACGYNLTNSRIAQLNDFLDKRNAARIDVPTLLATLTYLKELELQAEQENESDEYLDCFVSLGGQPDKEGYV